MPHNTLDTKFVPSSSTGIGGFQRRKNEEYDNPGPWIIRHGKIQSESSNRSDRGLSLPCILACNRWKEYDSPL